MKITILLACLAGLAVGGAREVAANPCAAGRCELRSAGGAASSVRPNSARTVRRTPLRTFARRLLCRRNC